MKVSIIIPLYNSQDYIAQTIESCMNQTHSDIEIVVVDDCSSDKSVETVKKLMKEDSRIRLYCNGQNMGVIRTTNFGIKQSNGEYIMVLGNDDILANNHIEVAVNKLEEKRYSFLYFSSDLIDEHGNVFGERVVEDVNGQYYLFARKNPVNACGAMINANYLKQIGGFPEKLGYRNCGEWYLWIELLKHDKCAYIKEVKSFYRIHSNNLTKKLYSKENIKMTKDYSLICMKDALNLQGISLNKKVKYTMFRMLYRLKMNLMILKVK